MNLSGDYSSGALFEEDDLICVVIQSQSDSILENSERFSIFLDMLDPAVHIEQPSNSAITIVDNDCKSKAFFSCNITQSFVQMLKWGCNTMST